MLSNLKNLSGLANILPYYGDYENKLNLVESINPGLLPKFLYILGGIFSDAEYTYNLFKYHTNWYQWIEKKHPNLYIDFGSEYIWNTKTFEVRRNNKN
jgi:hypothetical protein